MAIATPQEVLAFWLDEKGPEAWYAGGEALDTEIRDRFRDTWQSAVDGRLGLWLTYPSGALAYLIVTDQFSRNMFRGTAEAYCSDELALGVALAAVDHGYDMKIDKPARQFFYMPFEHSESLTNQEHAVRLMKERMDDSEMLLHARAHREIIRRFGRFPFRNAHLGRKTTQAEQEFLDAGAYGAMVAQLRQAA